MTNEEIARMDERARSQVAAAIEGLGYLDAWKMANPILRAYAQEATYAQHGSLAESEEYAGWLEHFAAQVRPLMPEKPAPLSARADWLDSLNHR